MRALTRVRRVELDLCVGAGRRVDAKTHCPTSDDHAVHQEVYSDIDVLAVSAPGEGADPVGQIGAKFALESAHPGDGGGVVVQ